MLIKRLNEETAVEPTPSRSLDDLLAAYEQITKEISAVLSSHKTTNTANECKDSKKKVAKAILEMSQELMDSLSYSIN